MNKHKSVPIDHCNLLEAVTIAGSLADLTLSIVGVFQIADLALSILIFELQIRSDLHRRCGHISFPFRSDR